METFNSTKNLIRKTLLPATGVARMRAVLLATALAVGVGGASAAPISLINHGFETGDLTGWNTIGQVTAASTTNVTTNNGTNYTISPSQTTMAFLDSYNAGVGTIENFLGLTNGILQSTSLATGQSSQSLTNGSAISQNFLANAGDTISMFWNYAARDYIPHTDPSFGVLVAPDGSAVINILASTTGPGLVTGSDGISGVFSFNQLLTQTGEYKLGFAVTNSGDTSLNAALFLDNQPSACNPSCNPLGSPENPLLPTPDNTPGLFDFSFTVTQPGIPIFIDPIIAIGYDYIVNSGPNIAGVILPNIGDGQYELYGWGGSSFDVLTGVALAGIQFDFAPGGVDRFRVLGIETSAMLDPMDPVAFVTGLTFVSAGTVDMSQIPVTLDVANVPEPMTLSLLGAGLMGICFLRRRAQRTEADKLAA